MITNEIPANPIITPKRGIIGWALLPFQAVWDVFSSIFWGIASLLGFQRPVPQRVHEYVDTADVDLELTKARDLETGNQVFESLDPAGTVMRYAASSTTERAMLDLSALTADQQDWLTGLYDRDLALIGMSGRRSAERSLEAGMLILTLPRPVKEKPAPEILAVPEQAEAVVPDQMPKSDMTIIQEGFMAALTNTPRPYDYRPH